MAEKRHAGEHLQGLQKNVDLWTTIRGHPTYIVAFLVFLFLNLKIWYITEIIVSHFPLSLAAAFLRYWGLVVKFLMHYFHSTKENVSFELGLITHSKKLAEAVLTQYLWRCSHIPLCFHPSDRKKINKNSLFLQESEPWEFSNKFLWVPGSLKRQEQKVWLTQLSCKTNVMSRGSHSPICFGAVVSFCGPFYKESSI